MQPFVAHAVNYTTLPSQQDIDPLKTWTIKFSQKVGNVTNSMVLDSAGHPVAITITTADTQVKIAAPYGGYKYGETYTLLLGNIYDKKGKLIKSAQRMDFTIATTYQPKVIASIIDTDLIINNQRYRTNMKYHSFIRANQQTLQGASLVGVVEGNEIVDIKDLRIVKTVESSFNGFNHSFETLSLEGPFTSIRDVKAHNLLVNQATLLERVTVYNHFDVQATALGAALTIQSSKIHQLRNYQKDVRVTTYNSKITKTEAFADFSLYYDGPTMQELILHAYDFNLKGRFATVQIPFSQQDTVIRAQDEADVQIEHFYYQRSSTLHLENTVRVANLYIYDDEATLKLTDLSHIAMLSLPKLLKIEDALINYPHYMHNVASHSIFYTFNVDRYSDDFGYFNIFHQTDATDYDIYYEAYTNIDDLPKLDDYALLRATKYTGERIAYEPGKQYAFYLVKNYKIVQMDLQQLNEVDFPWYDLLVTNTTVTIRFAEAIKENQLKEIRLYYSARNHTTLTDFSKAVWQVKDGKTQITIPVSGLEPRHNYYGFAVITTNHMSGQIFNPTPIFNTTTLYQTLGDHYTMRLLLLHLLEGDAIVRDTPVYLERYAKALQTQKRITAKHQLYNLIKEQNNN